MPDQTFTFQTEYKNFYILPLNKYNCQCQSVFHHQEHEAAASACHTALNEVP
jgi:hypothetical protein